ncbi:MAG: transposase [Niameybacter sp.]|uniref:RNA-guided endonuclease InsQ/TnpB family protein n=1 Tax=Niameybacter sp. TaxID=2033640 RepID=UPI002FC8A633
MPISRKYIMNKEGSSYKKTSNIIKSEKELFKLNHKLTNMRHSYQLEVVNDIINRKPKFITIEDLNIGGMMKNKHLSKAIQQQALYEFTRILGYKCTWNGIELRQVDRWYPSSKLCHECGSVKRDLKLSDRTYICDVCGNVINRDFQASLNLRDATEYKIVSL